MSAILTESAGTRNKPLSILITGFSSFPGARTNPTEALALALLKRQARFARLGVRLETRVLPVVYSKIAPAIAQHAENLSPDIILHFGLAARRPHICIETLARNRLNRIHFDADGQRAGTTTVLSGGPPFKRAQIATVEIAASLRRAGFSCRLSNDAGDYLCNAALYLSLAKPHAPHVGFIHVPPLSAKRPCPDGDKNHRRLTLPDLLRAAELAALTAIKAARRHRPSV